MGQRSQMQYHYYSISVSGLNPEDVRIQSVSPKVSRHRNVTQRFKP